jgi:TolB-like protein/DNA-binding winged helix-turn-helix (wHTH) protein/Tfp pilus assembly protein PilF
VGMDGNFHVAEWLVEPDLNTVCRNGETVHLQPKVMKVLVCLAQRAGKPVSKEELLQSVWTDTFVTDDVLKRSISELRRVFGDDAQESRIIQTIPKRGYRLLAPVHPVTPQAEPLGTPGNEPVWRETGSKQVLRLALAIVLLAVLAAAVLLRWKHRSEVKHSSIRIRSIAVLPLENLSSDAVQEYFSEGMTDGLITNLAQIPSLKVISRTSSVQYKQTKKSLPEVARELNVDGIIEGTVQRSGDRVRITAQLIEASTDHPLWANTYEEDTPDVFNLQKQVAEDIAHQVLAHVTAPSQSSIAQSHVANSQALEEYLQGNYHLHRFSRGAGDEELKAASEHFQRAINADPNFALAHVGLAAAHNSTFRSGSDDVTAARDAAERALQLDPSLSEAWEMLGDIKGVSWHWVEAEKDLRQAIELNPNNADAHDDLGDLLDSLARPEEGWKEYQFAQELDPNRDHLEFALYKRHEYDHAIQVAVRMLEGDPNSGYLHHQLYENYVAKGMHKEAIEQLQQAVTLFGFADLAAELRRAYAASGYLGAMREYAKQLERLHATKRVFMPINIAAVYAAIGEKDRAFYWLEKGYEQRGHQSAGVVFTELGVYPGLDPLRSDERFTNLLQRMRLPAVRIDESRQASGTGNKALLSQ